MKKLFAILPAIALVTACTNTPIAKPSPSQVQAVQANSQTFKCDNNTEVVAIYTENNGDNYANLKVTSPSLSLNQTALVLKQDVSGSGVRYTTTTADKSTSYEWHVKGGEGVFGVTHQGKSYEFMCNAN